MPISYRVDGGHRRIESEAEEREEVLGYEEIFDARDATNDLAYGMAHMYAIMTQELDVPVEVFRSLEAAEAWLADRRPGQPESA
jgi:hypothetical protein